MYFTHKKWIVFLLSLFFTGCFTALPTQQNEMDCELWSRKWELKISEEEGGHIVEGIAHTLVYCSEPECALYGLLGMVAIPVTSFIVSGSIVVVGNTVHWLEEQGTCEKSMTQEALEALVESTQSAGGMIVQTGNELVRWVKRHSGFESVPEHLPKDKP